MLKICENWLRLLLLLIPFQALCLPDSFGHRVLSLLDTLILCQCFCILFSSCLGGTISIRSSCIFVEMIIFSQFRHLYIFINYDSNVCLVTSLFYLVSSIM